MPNAGIALGGLASGLASAFTRKQQEDFEEKKQRAQMLSSLVSGGIQAGTIQDPNQAFQWLLGELGGGGKSKGKGGSKGAQNELPGPLKTIINATQMAGGRGNQTTTGGQAKPSFQPPQGIPPPSFLSADQVAQQTAKDAATKTTATASASFQAKVDEAQRLRQLDPSMSIEDSLDAVGLRTPVKKAETSKPLGKPIPSDSLPADAKAVDGTPLDPKPGQSYQPVLFEGPKGAEVRYNPGAATAGGPQLTGKLKELYEAHKGLSDPDPSVRAASQEVISQAKTSEEGAVARLASVLARNAGQQALGPGIGPKGEDLPQVSLDSNGRPDAQAQTELLGHYSPQVRAQIKGLADYTINPTTFSTRTTTSKAGSDLTRAQAIALAKQYDPTYDERQYGIRNKVETDWTSGKTRDAMVAVDKVVQHLAELKEGTDALNPYTYSTFPVLNQAKLKAQRQTNPAVRQGARKFEEARDAVALELRKVYSGSAGGSLKEIEDWQKNADLYAAPDDKATFLQTAVDLMFGQVNANTRKYQATMGKAPKAGLGISHQAVEGLQKLGIDTSKLDPGVVPVNPPGW